MAKRQQIQRSLEQSKHRPNRHTIYGQMKWVNKRMDGQWKRDQPETVCEKRKTQHLGALNAQGKTKTWLMCSKQQQVQNSKVRPRKKRQQKKICPQPRYLTPTRSLIQNMLLFCQWSKSKHILVFCEFFVIYDLFVLTHVWEMGRRVWTLMLLGGELLLQMLSDVWGQKVNDVLWGVAHLCPLFHLTPTQHCITQHPNLDEWALLDKDTSLDRGIMALLLWSHCYNSLMLGFICTYQRQKRNEQSYCIMFVLVKFWGDGWMIVSSHHVSKHRMYKRSLSRSRHQTLDVL